jgi:Skp family chaperone for outer membrane proteins
MSTFKRSKWSLASLAAGIAVAAIGASMLVRPVRGADPPAAGPLVIGIANPETIAESIKEYKDLIGAMDEQQKNITATATDKQNNVNALKQALTYLKPDTQQYADEQDKLLKAAIEYDAWTKETQLDFDRTRKTKIKNLFQEIQDAVAQVAQKEGINLVLADQRPRIPDNLDNIDVNQLQAAISARTILYSDESRDITGKVITYMDDNYHPK